MDPDDPNIPSQSASAVTHFFSGLSLQSNRGAPASLEAVHAPVADIRGAEVVHPVGEIHMRTDALENPEEGSQCRSSASFAENENKALLSKAFLSKNMSGSFCCFGEDEEEELARQVAKCSYVSQH
jgi:hypothetical protein